MEPISRSCHRAISKQSSDTPQIISQQSAGNQRAISAQSTSHQQAILRSDGARLAVLRHSSVGVSRVAVH
eukprot:7387659-Prymnesium_polylepis.1